MHQAKVKSRIVQLFVLLALAPALGSPLLAQGSDRPDQGYGPVDTSPPSIPPEQIIQQFAAKESEFRQALDNYTYQRDVTVETIDEDGRPDGVYREVTQISFDNQSRKIEHVTFAPASTLDSAREPNDDIMMSPADMSDIEHRLPFVLTSQDIGEYNLKYVGRQTVDQVDTYIFDVAPKVIQKNRRYFQGRIWVDQKDLQIVITSGKNVPDDTRKGHEDLSPPFTTYREQVDGKYWFPVYTKADAILHFTGGTGYASQDVHIREILRYTDYKQFRSNIKLIFQGQDVTNKTNQPANTPPPANGPPVPADGTSAAPK